MAVTRSRKARAARRRKSRMARVDHDLSATQWNALKAARGGRYTLENIAPACRSCNASKGSEEVTTWLRRRRLGEGSFLLRHFEVDAAPDPVDQSSARG